MARDLVRRARICGVEPRAFTAARFDLNRKTAVVLRSNADAAFVSPPAVIPGPGILHRGHLPIEERFKARGHLGDDRAEQQLLSFDGAWQSRPDRGNEQPASSHAFPDLPVSYRIATVRRAARLALATTGESALVKRGIECIQPWQRADESPWMDVRQQCVVNFNDALSFRSMFHCALIARIGRARLRVPVDEVAPRIQERIRTVRAANLRRTRVGEVVGFPIADRAIDAPVERDGRIAATVADGKTWGMSGVGRNERPLDALIVEGKFKRALPQVQRQELFGCERHSRRRCEDRG